MLLAAALLSLIPVGCGKNLNIDPPTPVPGGGGGDTPTPDSERPTEPTICTNKVVAHRGGSAECGQPDNSRASLKYAMSLKCYASECDIYWTKDNDVIIAHAKDKFFINGLRPWEHTVLEIRRAGKLTNGEEIPTLTDFLDIVQVKDNCTKLCLDIKNLEGFPDYPSKAVMRACEIIANSVNLSAPATRRSLPPRLPARSNMGFRWVGCRRMSRPSIWPRALPGPICARSMSSLLRRKRPNGPSTSISMRV